MTDKTDQWPSMQELPPPEIDAFAKNLFLPAAVWFAIKATLFVVFTVGLTLAVNGSTIGLGLAIGSGLSFVGAAAP